MHMYTSKSRARRQRFGLVASSTFLLLGLASQPAVAQTGNNLWSNPATWGGKVPKAGDKVVIPAKKTVILDVATPALKGLQIDGTLTAADKDISITSDYVVVMGGTFQIGSAARPFTKQATITLTGNTTADIKELPGVGNKVLAVMGGTLQFFGRPAAKNWTRLGATVAAGSRQITLAEAPGWRVGDSVVISTSTRDMSSYDVAQITAISGAVATLKAPLKFGHIGKASVIGGKTLDIRSQVGLLSHNIKVQGDANSEKLKIGGHAMFMNGMCPCTGAPGCQCMGSPRGAIVQISGAEFRNMGQLNVKGRYPIHFHLMGATAGSFVENTSVHDSIQRGIVLHDVSNVRASNNVIFNTVGHNFVVETEATTGNYILNNLSLVNRQASPLQTEAVFVEQADRLPANFWMKSGRNTVTGNVAAGSFDSGFIFDDILGDGPLKFRNNVAHAAMGREGFGAGDFDLAAGILVVSQHERPVTDEIVDNFVYHNTIGFWPEEAGLFRIEGLVSADNDLHTENRGVGNRVRYRNSFFVGTLTEPREFAGPAVHFQYGSDVTLDGATFANFDGAIGAFTDIAVAPQANLWVSGIKYVNSPRPYASLGDDQVTTYLDDTVLPKGTYVYGKEFAGPGAVKALVTDSDGTSEYWKNPRRFNYTEIDVRDLGSFATQLQQTTNILRSDGHRYKGGLFGYTAVYDGGYSFTVEAPAPKGYAIRLHEGAVFSQDVINEKALLEVSAPFAKAPASVHRSGTDWGNLDEPSASTKLRQAKTRTEFNANPLTTYLYEGGKVFVKASVRWTVIRP